MLSTKFKDKGSNHRLPLDWTFYSKRTYTILQYIKHIKGKGNLLVIHGSNI